MEVREIEEEENMANEERVVDEVKRLIRYLEANDWKNVEYRDGVTYIIEDGNRDPGDDYTTRTR